MYFSWAVHLRLILRPRTQLYKSFVAQSVFFVFSHLIPHLWTFRNPQPLILQSRATVNARLVQTTQHNPLAISLALGPSPHPPTYFEAQVTRRAPSFAAAPVVP